MIFLLIVLLKAENIREIGVMLPKLQDQIVGSVAFIISTFLGGLLFTVLGGYVAARIAKFSELKHAMWEGIIALLTSAPFILTLKMGWLLMWLTIIGIILTIPSAMLGGYIRLLTIKEKKNDTSLS